MASPGHSTNFRLVTTEKLWYSVFKLSKKQGFQFVRFLKNFLSRFFYYYGIVVHYFYYYKVFRSLVMTVFVQKVFKKYFPTRNLILSVRYIGGENELKFMRNCSISPMKKKLNFIIIVYLMFIHLHFILDVFGVYIICVN